MKTLSQKIIYSLIGVSIFLLPGSVLASTIYIDANHSKIFEGDTILFNVRIDSEGKNINAVEGGVLLDHESGAVSLVDIGTSGSEFSLWPSKPLPSERNTQISFTGGVPGGFVSKDAIIFNIALKFNKTGLVSLSPNNIKVYINDGKGTEDKVQGVDLLINALPRKPNTSPVDDLSALISSDKTAPEPFEIYLGQDSTVFDGKKFLSFNTVDKQSGISYYEVFEGNLPPVRSDNTYILREQKEPVEVTVIAYDGAGNTRKAMYSPAPDTTAYLNIAALIGAVLLSIILFILIFRMIFKKKRK
jgi:hypothetical protein